MIILSKYIKYLKAFLFIIIPIFIFNLIFSFLYYNDIISSSINSYLSLFVVAISFLFGGIYLGNKVTNKGYLEGLKIGLVIILLFIVFSLIFKLKLGTNSFIYYIMILASSIIGSMIGINKKD